jgi:copper(I)-binding protein
MRSGIQHCDRHTSLHCIKGVDPLMKRSILILLALFVTAAPAWAAPSATKAVKAESEGVTTLAVTVTSDEDVYAVTITGAAIDDVRAPHGWVGVASGNHVMFMTGDNPVKAGSAVAFKIMTTEPSAALKVSFRGKEDPIGKPMDI